MIWFLWDHKSNCPISGKRRIITIIVATVLVFFYQNALEFLSSHVTFLSTYEGYAEISTRGQNRDLYVHIIEWVIIYFLQKHMEEDKAVVMMINMLTISVLIGFTGFTHPQVKEWHTISKCQLSWFWQGIFHMHLVKEVVGLQNL